MSERTQTLLIVGGAIVLVYLLFMRKSHVVAQPSNGPGYGNGSNPYPGPQSGGSYPPSQGTMGAGGGGSSGGDWSGANAGALAAGIGQGLGGLLTGISGIVNASQSYGSGSNSGGPSGDPSLDASGDPSGSSGDTLLDY